MWWDDLWKGAGDLPGNVGESVGSYLGQAGEEIGQAAGEVGNAWEGASQYFGGQQPSQSYGAPQQASAGGGDPWAALAASFGDIPILGGIGQALGNAWDSFGAPAAEPVQAQPAPSAPETQQNWLDMIPGARGIQDFINAPAGSVQPPDWMKPFSDINIGRAAEQLGDSTGNKALQIFGGFAHGPEEFARRVEPYAPALATMVRNPDPVEYVGGYARDTGDILGTAGRAMEVGYSPLDALWQPMVKESVIQSRGRQIAPDNPDWVAQVTGPDLGYSLPFDAKLSGDLQRAYESGMSAEEARRTIWEPRKNEMIEAAPMILNPLQFLMPGLEAGKMFKGAFGAKGIIPVAKWLETNGMRVTKAGDEAENLVARTLAELHGRPEGASLEEGANLLNDLIKGTPEALARSPEDLARPEVQHALGLMREAGLEFPGVREVKPFNLPVDEKIVAEQLARLPGAQKSEIMSALAQLNAQDEAKRLSTAAVEEFKQKAGDVARSAYAKQLGYDVKAAPINLPVFRQAYQLNRWVKRQTGPLFLSLSPRYHIGNMATNLITHLQGGHLGIDTARHVERRLGQLEGLAIPDYVKRDFTGTANELARGAKPAIVEQIPGLKWLSDKGARLANWIERSGKLNTFEDEYYKQYNRLWQQKIATLGITDPEAARQLAMSAHLGQTKQIYADIAQGRVTAAFSDETLKAYNALPAEYQFAISEELARNPDKVRAIDDLIKRFQGVPERSAKAAGENAAEFGKTVDDIANAPTSEADDILSELNPNLPGANEHVNAMQAIGKLMNDPTEVDRLAGEFEGNYLRGRGLETIDETLQRALPTGTFADHMGTGADLRRSELGLLAFYIKRAREVYRMELINPRFVPGARGKGMSWIKFEAKAIAPTDPISLYGLDGGTRKLEELLFRDKAGNFHQAGALKYEQNWYRKYVERVDQVPDFTAWSEEVKRKFAESITQHLADRGIVIPRPDLVKDAEALWKADPALRPQILSKLIEKDAPELKGLDITQPLDAAAVEGERAAEAIRVLEQMRAEAMLPKTVNPQSLDLEKILAAQRDTMAEASRLAEQEVVHTYRDYRQRDKLDVLLDHVSPYQYWFRRNLAYQIMWAAENPGKALAAYRLFQSWWNANRGLPFSQRLTVPLGEVNGTTLRVGPVSMLAPFATASTALMQELSPESQYDRGIGEEIQAGDWGAAGKSAYNMLSRGLGMGPNVGLTTGARALQRVVNLIGTPQQKAAMEELLGPLEDTSQPLFQQEELARAALAGAGIDATNFAQKLLYGTDLSVSQRLEIGNILAGMVQDGSTTMQEASQALADGEGNPLFDKAKLEALSRLGTAQAVRLGGLPVLAASQDKQAADALRQAYRVLPKGSEERNQLIDQNPQIKLLWNATGTPEERKVLPIDNAYWTAVMVGKEKKDLNAKLKLIAPEAFISTKDGQGVYFSTRDIAPENLPAVSRLLAEYAAKRPGGLTAEEQAKAQEFTTAKDAYYALTTPELQVAQDQYFAYPQGSKERKAVLAAHPELKTLWDAKDQFIVDHPVLTELDPERFAAPTKQPTTAQKGYSAPVAAGVPQYTPTNTNYTYTPSAAAVKQAKGTFYKRWNALTAKEQAAAQADPIVAAALNSGTADELAYLAGFDRLAQLNKRVADGTGQGLDQPVVKTARTSFWGILTQIPVEARKALQGDLLLALVVKKGAKGYVPAEVYLDGLLRLRELLTGEKAPVRSALTDEWISQVAESYGVAGVPKPSYGHRGGRPRSYRPTYRPSESGPAYHTPIYSPKFNFRGRS